MNVAPRTTPPGSLPEGEPTERDWLEGLYPWFAYEGDPDDAQAVYDDHAAEPVDE